MERMSAERLTEPAALLSDTEHYLLLIYRVATYITFNVMDDAAMLAFGLS